MSKGKSYMLEADSTSDVLLPNTFSDPNQGKSYDGVLLIAYSRSFRVLEFLSVGWKLMLLRLT